MKPRSSLENIYAVLYIEEHSIRSALVEPTEPLSILDIHTHTSVSGESQEALLRRTVKSLGDSLIERAKSGKISHLAGTLSVFGTSLYVCHLGSVRYAPEDQFELDQKLLGNVVNSYREKNQKSKNRSISITKMLLNGYEVSEISGVKGGELEMHMCESEPQEEAVRITTKAINSLGGKLAIEPAVFIAFSVIRDLYTELNNFQVLVVGESISELLEVRDSSMSQIVSFPFGENDLVSYLNKELRLSPDDVRTNLALLNDNALSHKEAAKMAKALEGAYASWGELFKKGMAELSEKGSLPSSFFLFSEPTQSRIWKAYFESNSLLNTLTPGKLEVISADQGLLRKLVRSKTGKLVHPILAAGAAHLFQGRQFI